MSPQIESRSPELFALMASFDTPEQLLQAVHSTRQQGYFKIDAYTPMPIEGLAEEIGFYSDSVSMITFFGGFLGASGGFGLMWWMTVIAYPHIVDGRPLNSWPAYIPITFECMVLVASLSAVFGMLALNGFPRPYHPVFNVPQFERASRDLFFLSIEASDPQWNVGTTRTFLESLHPREVMEVEP